MLESFLKISYFHGKQYLWVRRVSVTASLLWVQSWAQSYGPLPAASLHTGSWVPMGVGHLVGCETVHHTLSHMPLFWPHWLSVHSTSWWFSSCPEFSYMGFPSQPFVFVLFLSQPEPVSPASCSSLRFWRSIWCSDILAEWNLPRLYAFSC